MKGFVMLNEKLAKTKTWISTQFTEHPMEMIALTITAAAVATKLINATVSAQNSATWRKEVNRRNRMK